MGRGLVPEPARSEMHADPNPIRLIGENVDVMIAAADRAELCSRALLQLANGRKLQAGSSNNS